jgi:hypothetical protein
MDQHPLSCQALHFMIAILAAFNVALNTWLVNRRSQADKREAKRDGNGDAQAEPLPLKLNRSESATSVRDSTPKD